MAIQTLLTVAAAAVLLAIASMPASSHLDPGADLASRGVGAFGMGVGPRFWRNPDYWRGGYYTYGREATCRLVRKRILISTENAIVETRLICD
jgi:hypothetical protein